MGERSNRGQVLPFLAVVVFVAGGLVVMVARVGAKAVASAQARTAADAAALAGAAGGEPEARAMARANGGRLVRFERLGLDVRVRVEVAGRASSARARALGFSDLSGGSGVGGLAPALRAAIARAQQLLGAPIPITSGYRSPAVQAGLYARRAMNRYPVAPPGSSKHERGLAIDVPVGFADKLATVGPSAGLCRPYPRTDPVHFELCLSVTRTDR